AAKALDEVEGAQLRFVTRPGEADRAGAARLAKVVGRARAWLVKASGEPTWPLLELDDEDAVDVLGLFGPYSVFLTAAAPGGEATLRALFAAIAGDQGLDAGSAFLRPTARRLLDTVAFRTRSARQRTV